MRGLIHALHFDRDENAGLATYLHAVCTRWLRAAYGVDTTLEERCRGRGRASACTSRRIGPA